MGSTSNTTQLIVKYSGKRYIANEGRITTLDSNSMVDCVVTDYAEKYDYALGKRILLSWAGSMDDIHLLVKRIQDHLLDGSLNHGAPLNLLSIAEEVGLRYPDDNCAYLIITDSRNEELGGSIIMEGKYPQPGYTYRFPNDFDGIGSGGKLAAHEFAQLLSRDRPNGEDEIMKMMYTAMDINARVRDECYGGTVRVNAVGTTGHWTSTLTGFIFNPIPRLNFYP